MGRTPTDHAGPRSSQLSSGRPVGRIRARWCSEPARRLFLSAPATATPIVITGTPAGRDVRSRDADPAGPRAGFRRDASRVCSGSTSAGGDGRVTGPPLVPTAIHGRYPITGNPSGSGRLAGRTKTRRAPGPARGDLAHRLSAGGPTRRIRSPLLCAHKTTSAPPSTELDAGAWCGRQ